MPKPKHWPKVGEASKNKSRKEEGSTGAGKGGKKEGSKEGRKMLYP